ncbi:hypothetical protein RKD37_002318 [Streptomyces ambofaciens]
MTTPDTRVGLREYLGYWIGTVPVRLLGAAAVVMAWRPWATVGTAGDAVPFVCAVAFALWAAPSLDRRPSVEAVWWSYRLLRHRTTLLAGGVVVIAAFEEPAWWEGACVVGLLVAYLVTSETWPWRWGRGPARVWSEAVAALRGCGCGRGGGGRSGVRDRLGAGPGDRRRGGGGTGGGRWHGAARPVAGRCPEVPRPGELKGNGTTRSAPGKPLSPKHSDGRSVIRSQDIHTLSIVVPALHMTAGSVPDASPPQKK